MWLLILLFFFLLKLIFADQAKYHLQNLKIVNSAKIKGTLHTYFPKLISTSKVPGKPTSTKDKCKKEDTVD